MKFKFAPKVETIVAFETDDNLIEAIVISRSLTKELGCETIEISNGAILRRYPNDEFWKYWGSTRSLAKADAPEKIYVLDSCQQL